MKNNAWLFVNIALLLSACTPAPSSLVPSVALTVVASGSEATYTPSPTAAPTETPQPIDLAVSPEVLAALTSEKALNPDGSIKTNVLVNVPTETLKNLNIDPKLLVVLGEDVVHNPEVDRLVTYTDAATSKRYIWNEYAKGWTLDIPDYQDFQNPSGSPEITQKYVTDGSYNLDVALYAAEHPDMIPADAPYPHFNINMTGDDTGSAYFYELSIRKYNGPAFPKDQDTQLSSKTGVPLEYSGMAQFKDAQGNIIYVFAKANWDPIDADAKQITPTFHAMDKETYDKWAKYPLIFNYINDKKGEIVAVFPAPPGTYGFDPDTFYYENQPPNPHVARLLSPANLLKLFTSSQQLAIINAINHVREAFDPITNPKSITLDHLPDGISRMILYAALRAWE